MPNKITNVFAIALTLVGIMSSVGNIFKIQILREIGGLTQMSPAPAVYGDISDRKPPSDASEGDFFRCDGTSNEDSWMKWNYFLEEKIPGPHHLAVRIVTGVLSKDEAPKNLKKYFCGGGLLARALNCPRPVKTVDYKSIDSGQVTRELKVPCDD